MLAASLECREDAAFLAVHDGARPLATPELIDRVIAAAARCAAAVPAVAVKDTVKTFREDGGVEETLDRFLSKEGPCLLIAEVSPEWKTTD